MFRFRSLCRLVRDHSLQPTAFSLDPAAHTKKPPGLSPEGLLLRSGDDLLSRTVPRPVPSAQEGLTSVFGMGTGVAPPPWSPEALRGPDGRAAIPAQYPDIYAGQDSGSDDTRLSEEASRPISTARLNTLPCLHLRPIKLVVSEWPLGSYDREAYSRGRFRT